MQIRSQSISSEVVQSILCSIKPLSKYIVVRRLVLYFEKISQLKFFEYGSLSAYKFLPVKVLQCNS